MYSMENPIRFLNFLEIELDILFIYKQLKIKGAKDFITCIATYGDVFRFVRERQRERMDR